MRAALALAGLIALAGCKPDRMSSPSPSPAPDDRQQAARAAAEAALQPRLRGEGTVRGVQVYSQALPETVAVCGRSTMSNAAGAPLIPYVAVVSFEGDEPRVANLVLGATGPEATRVFVEMVDRCYDGGGPATARLMARNYPPLPAPPASAATPEPEIVAEMQPPAARPMGTVTVSSRSSANLRSSAQGPVIRTLPASSTWNVLGQAPGGWYQVGQAGSAMGWVHSSVLENPAR